MSFAPTTTYSATLTGNPVFIDGVAVTGSTSVMPIKGGKIAGLAELRDKAAVIYQDQLDEIARGLISAFRESDQSLVPALPDVPGLFTYPGAPAMPPSATVLAGLAGTIKVAASVDPALAGNPSLLRDGAISGGAAYRYNAAGNPGFSTRLHQLVDAMDLSQPFDPAAQAKTSASVVRTSEALLRRSKSLPCWAAGPIRNRGCRRGACWLTVTAPPYRRRLS